LGRSRWHDVDEQRRKAMGVVARGGKRSEESERQEREIGREER
jgi:hypothetical protein